MALDDEEDQWEKEYKDSLRYDIRLLIKHPNIDPARITETLRLQPSSSGIAGSPRITSVGKPLPGVHKDSGWTYRVRTERNRFFFSDVVKLIDWLEPQTTFLHGIVDGGGTIYIIAHLPGDTNIGDSFRWQDIARLSAMRIDLGIEVFPNFN